MNRRNLAFTMVEILVVISIILVLVGMVVFGIRKVNESSRRNASKVMMENGRSMLSEYNRAAAALPLPSQPLDLGSAHRPGNLNADAAESTGNADPNARYGRAVLYSRAVVGRLMQNPAVRKMVEAMPAEKLLQIPGAVNQVPGIVVYPSARPGAVPLMSYVMGPPSPLVDASPDAPPPPEAPGTVPCMCFAAFTDSAALNYSAAWPRQGILSQWHWLDIPNNASALLDGFGNPLIFIPTCGFLANGRLVTSGGTFTIAGSMYWNIPLARVYAVGEYAVYSADGRTYQVYRCNLAHTAAPANAPDQASAPWVRVATAPFFASAGPDGIFFDPARPETLDDNMYSFEN